MITMPYSSTEPRSCFSMPINLNTHVGLVSTRGTVVVKFDNPADDCEADFTVIVKDAYVYVLVDDEVVGEYSLPQSRPLKGNLGLTLLSGTNKDYGTRCEMTNIHAWLQKE